MEVLGLLGGGRSSVLCVKGLGGGWRWEHFIDTFSNSERDLIS